MAIPIQISMNARYGKLVVTDDTPTRVKSGSSYSYAYQCRCDCGNDRIVRAADLKSGNTTSCGCTKRAILEVNRISKVTHGKTDSHVYRIWQAMKRRCYRKAEKSYPDYGGRGIAVCAEWKDSFEKFYADMGDPPTLQHTLDRRNGDGPYSKDNCKWATRVEQMQHTRRSTIFQYNGEALTVAEIARRVDIPESTIAGRIKRGKTLDQAVALRPYDERRK